MLNETVNITPDLPSPIWTICGITAEKSIPGLAVPDSVHHVKVVSPRKLPLRRTAICADVSPKGTSTVSTVSSTFDDPAAATSGGADEGAADEGGAGDCDTAGGAAAAGFEVAGGGAVAVGAVAAGAGAAEPLALGRTAVDDGGARDTGAAADVAEVGVGEVAGASARRGKTTR